MRIDWLAKLQHMLQTLAFCLVVATAQYAFAPERPYAPAVAYSVAIGMIIWVIVDLGRHLFPSAAETGWPRGFAGVMLVAGGIAGGYFLGTRIADVLCRAFGWYAGAPRLDPTAELRNSVLITLIAGLTGSYWFYSRSRSAYLERKMQETRRLADEARLKLLEAQLEPHMLFNTLANLRALIAVDPARAQQMLDHMIAYLRATLGASRAATHPLQAEFDRLRDYLALMAIRMGPRLAYELRLPPDLAQVHVPTLLLQPLVENSIQHGLEPKVGGGRIDVTARTEGPRLVLEVADTGCGQSDASRAGKGFGLAQVRERLATLHGDAAVCEFTATPGRGARTLLTLPLPTA
jgi:signal transduction histidine kinase